MYGLTSHATQVLLTQKGAFGCAQSLSEAHATQRPLSTSQTGVPARCAQCASVVHFWHE
jgi:hypothetical protein